VKEGALNAKHEDERDDASEAAPDQGDAERCQTWPGPHLQSGPTDANLEKRAPYRGVSIIAPRG
jgi:hypothetical protein